MRRALLLALVSIALLGCAEDDPFDFAVTTQETAPAPEATDDATDADDSTPTTTTIFPPVNEDVPRPGADRIVDLRGQEVVRIGVGDDNTFDARFFRVDPGTQIVFGLTGTRRHNVLPAAEGAFPMIDADALETGPQALVLTAPGDYPFYCSLHGTPTRGQTGYVIVGDG